MKRFVAVLLGVVLVIGMTLILAAQPGPGPQRGQRGMNRAGRQFGMGRMIQNPEFRSKLGITEEQYGKLQTGFLNALKAAIKNRADLQIKRLELASLMDADKPDRAQINQKINEISALQTAQMKNHIDTRLLVKETLTAEQWTKFHEWQQGQARQMLQRRQERMGMMRGGEGPGRGPRAPRPPQPPPPPKPDENVQ